MNEVFDHLEDNKRAMNNLFKTLNEGMSNVMRDAAGIVDVYKDNTMDVQRNMMDMLESFDIKYRLQFEDIVSMHSEEVSNLFTSTKNKLDEVEMLLSRAQDRASNIDEVIQSIDKLSPVVSFIDDKIGSREDILEAMKRLETFSQSAQESFNKVNQVLQRSSMERWQQSSSAVAVILYYCSMYWLASMIIYSLKEASTIMTFIFVRPSTLQTIGKIMHLELLLFFGCEILLYVIKESMAGMSHFYNVDAVYDDYKQIYTSISSSVRRIFVMVLFLSFCLSLLGSLVGRLLMQSLWIVLTIVRSLMERVVKFTRDIRTGSPSRRHTISQGNARCKFGAYARH